MNAARTSRPSRLVRRLSRADRMAKLLTHYDFASLTTPKRVVPDEEALYCAIDPNALRAPDRFVGGVMMSQVDTCIMRRRAYAARAWLARRLARKALHAGLAAAWRGNAREDLYKFHLYTRALRQARAELGR